MQANYAAALKHVLKFEGGYSNHPSDPGGATNLGITHAVLAAFRGRSVTTDDVRALKLDEAAAIYKANYWDKIRGDELPAGIDLAAFDCAVNQGVGRATRLLQAAARVAQDGRIGAVTLKALGAADATELLSEFQARRMNSYGLLVSLFKVFGLGWSRRLIATQMQAAGILGRLALAEAMQPIIDRSPVPSEKI